MTYKLHTLSKTFARGLGLVGLTLGLALSTGAAMAMKIEAVKSKGGIEAWLVEQHGVPLTTLRFAFDGGNAQDPAGKEGLGNFITAMMDEGAGDLTSLQFQEREEELAMKLGFEDGKDAIYGSFETLTRNRDQATDMLKLALTKPRFDPEAVERIKSQILSGLAFADKDPNKVADREWYAAAFPGHPYGRRANGTAETVGSISHDDLAGYHKRVFARSNLKIVVVGDIDKAQLSDLLDKVFGDLPATAELTPVANVAPKTGGILKVTDMDVPQSVGVFGLGAMPRKDKDFIPASVMNQVLGGGGFASRLMEEVREKRGLAYSVYSYVAPLKKSSIFLGGVATRNDAFAQSLDVIKAELERMAKDGVTPKELDDARSFMTGSYALRFDTNSKTADQLLAIAREDLGLDYVDRRNGEIQAVTSEDVKRAAARLLQTNDLIISVVGRPKGVGGKG